MAPDAAAPVAIVGAGLVGLSCALSLQERGRAVRLIDPGPPGAGASHGNAGIVSPWSIVPQAVPGIWRRIPGWLLDPAGPLSIPWRHLPRTLPWGLRFLRAAGDVPRISQAMSALCGPSIELYRRHLQGTGAEGLIRDATYVHAFRRARDANLDGLDYRLRREAGARVERIDAAALAEREPALAPLYEAAILVHGQARALSPGGIARALADKARAQGATFLRARVRALARSGDAWRLDTDDGPVAASDVVLAANVWSVDLLRPFGLRLPLAAERGYHVEYPDAPATLADSVMDMTLKVVASSMEDGLRLAGTSEIAPADAPPSPARHRLLARQGVAMIPALCDAGPPRTWMGIRPSFPDSLPALGPINGLPGLHAAFGHSHYGLMMAPASARIVADGVTGARANRDTADFDPRRFA